MTVTVKAMPEGFLSSHLVSGLAPGTVVRLAAPRGDLRAAGAAAAVLLFLTAGSKLWCWRCCPTMKRRDQIGVAGGTDAGGVDVIHVHSARPPPACCSAPNW